MIKVEHLTKRYAGFTAIENLSFEVAKGEIVGFLGPNGAGKSTTMRILSGCMPATAGRASIAGFDVFTHSLEARRHIGYMPENVPLYTEMRVSEYLRYRASLKELSGSRKRERVGDVLELCMLKEVESRVISKLSKGYRQRVGLADALLASPDLLILDEPTSGLDPNQIRQVRELIRNLARHHTILLSTHILPEVEMTCGRVIIINRGHIEAADTPDNLIASLRTVGGIRLEAQIPAADDAATLITALPGVKEVLPQSEGESLTDGWSRFMIRPERSADPRDALWQLITDRRWKVREFILHKATLEDVFVELTQGDEA